MPPPSTRSDALRLFAVVAIWASTFESLSIYGFDIFPSALLHQLTLEEYLTLLQLLTLGVGMGAAFALLPRPESAFPFGTGSGRRSFLSTALVTPFVFSACTTVAFLVARPTLIAEIMAGGTQMAQKNTGQFGRDLVESPALLAFIWGAVISPLGEELFFRGALWSFVQRFAARIPVKWIARGNLTTVIVGSAFGALHWDMPGGLGIVRFVSALGLGLACGLGRQLTGSVAVPIVLHALFNALSLATVRRWVVTETFPMQFGAPTLVTGVGVVGVVVALVLYRTSDRSVHTGEP